METLAIVAVIQLVCCFPIYDFQTGFLLAVNGTIFPYALRKICHTVFLILNGLACIAETVWLEFNQYTLGSRWRRAAINRKSHREEGNEAEGFYGGIRKLKTKDEINIWKRLWPTETLE